MRHRFILVLLIPFQLVCVSGAEVYSDSNPPSAPLSSSSAEEAASWEAMRELHRQMDDDHSGTVDLAESVEFVEDELGVKEKTASSSRQQAFHHDDSQITLTEMWTRWLESPERRWTVKQLTSWLINSVHLPQYSGLFLKAGVDGRQLPRIAANTSYLASVLRIPVSAHRKKLQLRALDVVLFGFADGDAEMKKIDADELAAYDAIKELHKQMDDDHSGSIDLAETKEFVEDELQIQDQNRHKSFHDEDSQITVDDLWDRWKESQEIKWTTRDVVNWVVRTVELPQYAESFMSADVDGRKLPRIASLNTSFLTNVLHVTNLAHRKKLQVRAMDVVLFGYSGGIYSRLKDGLLVALVCLLVGSYWFFVRQRRLAQEDLTRQMSRLKEIEKDLMHLEKQRTIPNNLNELDDEDGGYYDSMTAEEVTKLKDRLEYAERQLELQGSGLAPLALQPLLKVTYENELTHLRTRKQENLRETVEARDMVEKLKKRQASPFIFRNALAYANEDVDARMLNLKSKIERTAKSMDEFYSRWAQIESLCGFPVSTHTPSSNNGVNQYGAHSGLPTRSGPGSIVSSLSSFPTGSGLANAGGPLVPVPSGSGHSSKAAGSSGSAMLGSTGGGTAQFQVSSVAGSPMESDELEPFPAFSQKICSGIPLKSAAMAVRLAASRSVNDFSRPDVNGSREHLSQDPAGQIGSMANGRVVVPRQAPQFYAASPPGRALENTLSPQLASIARSESAQDLVHNVSSSVQADALAHNSDGILSPGVIDHQPGTPAYAQMGAVLEVPTLNVPDANSTGGSLPRSKKDPTLTKNRSFINKFVSWKK